MTDASLPPPVGENGYKARNFDSFPSVEIKELYDWSGALLADAGLENVVVTDGKHNFDIRFKRKGTSGNRLFIKSSDKLQGKISITGSNNKIMICGECPWPSRLSINLNGNGSTLFIGAGSTFVGTEMFVTGDGVSIICGEDCMFSHGTMVRTYDQHAILNLETGDWVNKPRSVLIGPHVWVGQESLILKGSKINTGSIIGARSTVTNDVPASSLALGSPARVQMSDVSWVRDDIPNAEKFNKMKESLMSWDDKAK